VQFQVTALNADTGEFVVFAGASEASRRRRTAVREI